MKDFGHLIWQDSFLRNVIEAKESKVGEDLKKRRRYLDEMEKKGKLVLNRIRNSNVGRLPDVGGDYSNDKSSS